MDDDWGHAHFRKPPIGGSKFYSTFPDHKSDQVPLLHLEAKSDAWDPVVLLMCWSLVVSPCWFQQKISLAGDFILPQVHGSECTSSSQDLAGKDIKFQHLNRFWLPSREKNDSNPCGFQGFCIFRTHMSRVKKRPYPTLLCLLGGDSPFIVCDLWISEYCIGRLPLVINQLSIVSPLWNPCNSSRIRPCKKQVKQCQNRFSTIFNAIHHQKPI